MKKEQGAVVDRRGNAIGAVAVTVYNHGTEVLATIYSDEGITPQANPFNVDSYGRWSFYVANGRYDIKFSGSTINVFLMEDVLIEDAASANAVSIQGHDVNEAALGDDKILVYKVAGDEFVYEAKEAPAAHADTHENGGGDEISVTGLSGLLADPQDPTAHHLDHENGGGDEIDLTGLSGLLADPQIPLAHKTLHQDGGADEISVTGLSGLLADAQTPLAHKTSHENAGGDEISVSGLSGVLGDKQDADKIQGHTVDETAIGNDKVLVYKTSGTKFVYESKGTPGIHALSHQYGGGDEIDVTALSGLLADLQDAGWIQGHIIDEAALGNDKILVYKTSGDKFVYEAKGTPAGHAASHQDGGGDEIDLTDLSGEPADCVISAGRSGGQTIYGSPDVDECLYLASNPVSGGWIRTSDKVEINNLGAWISDSRALLYVYKDVGLASGEIDYTASFATKSKGDNTTYIGSSAVQVLAFDREDVTALNKGVLYGMTISTHIHAARNNVPFDDVACLMLLGLGDFKGTDCLYLGHFEGMATPEWFTGLNIDAWCDQAIALKGQFDYGIHFPIGTFAETPILLPNAQGIKAMNAAENAELPLIYMNADDKVIIGDFNMGLINNAPRGFLLNGKIVPSVSSGNLTLAIKTLAGTDPSATDPVYCRIGDAIRTITSALSVTNNAATNWCNSGSAELAGKEVDRFAYLGYNATDGVVIGHSRIPWGTQYGDFSTTPTDQNYCCISTITHANSADYYEVIGRFAATLSAGAGYTWSVPSFTASNLINRPIYETRHLNWQPVYACSGSMTFTETALNSAQYRIIGRVLNVNLDVLGTTGGTADTAINASSPIKLGTGKSTCLIFDMIYTGFLVINNSSGFWFYRSDLANWNLGVSREIASLGTYPLN